MLTTAAVAAVPLPISGLLASQIYSASYSTSMETLQVFSTEMSGGRDRPMESQIQGLPRRCRSPGHCRAGRLAKLVPQTFGALLSQGLDVGNEIVDIAPTERHAGHGGMWRGQPGFKPPAALFRVRCDCPEGRSDVASGYRTADKMAAGAPLLGKDAAGRGVAGLCRCGCQSGGKRDCRRDACLAASDSSQAIDCAMENTGNVLCHDRIAAPPMRLPKGRTMWRAGPAGIDMAQAR